MKNMVFFDVIYKTEIAVTNSIQVRTKITSYNQTDTPKTGMLPGLASSFFHALNKPLILQFFGSEDK